MSKPPTPRFQYEKTQALLDEIRSRSNRSLQNLYAVIASECGGVVSGDSHLRQLASGHRFLTDENLAKLAKWAIGKQWGGAVARGAVAYVAPDDKSSVEVKRKKRHERYLMDDPVNRIVEGPMAMVEQERRRSVAALDAALSKMSPAGFTHSEVLYMVYSWLVKNPPTARRGKRQRNIVLVDDPQGRGLEAPIFPESLPPNFSLPEHHNGFPWNVECQVWTPWEGFEGLPPDRGGHTD